MSATIRKTYVICGCGCGRSGDRKKNNCENMSAPLSRRTFPPLRADRLSSPPSLPTFMTVLHAHFPPPPIVHRIRVMYARNLRTRILYASHRTPDRRCKLPNIVRSTTGNTRIHRAEFGGGPVGPPQNKYH